MEWLKNQIKVDPPKRPKKVTGTRFAAIMGLNAWNTPFKTWCEITRTYEEPFEDTIYTIAGKTIEPKQADFMKKTYFMENLKTPTDIFGKDYFNKTFGDFFHDSKIFGGMWDYLLYDENGNVDTVLEMKTTKRSEDWADGIPEYYALQAALYAHLLGVDKVMMVASFLEDKDYEHPENFVPSVENTTVIPFKVSEKYPNFKKYLEKAEKFWADHVETGLSPEWDEKKDADIIKALRTNNYNPESDITALINEGEEIIEKMDELSAQIAKEIEPLEKRLKSIKEQIKKHAMEQMTDDTDKVAIKGQKYMWQLSKSVSQGINEDKLKEDGIYDKYLTDKVSYRFTTPKIKN